MGMKWPQLQGLTLPRYNGDEVAVVAGANTTTPHL